MAEPTIGKVFTDMEREIEAELRNRLPVQEPRPVNIAPSMASGPDLAIPD
jgi:hypothetical protein